MNNAHYNRNVKIVKKWGRKNRYFKGIWRIIVEKTSRNRCTLLNEETGEVKVRHISRLMPI